MIDLRFMLSITPALSDLAKIVSAIEEGHECQSSADGASILIKRGVMHIERVLSTDDSSIKTIAEVDGVLVLERFRKAVETQEGIVTSFHFPTFLTLTDGERLLKVLDDEHGSIAITHPNGVFNVSPDRIQMTSTTQATPQHRLYGEMTMGGGMVERAYIENILVPALQQDRSRS